MFLKHKHFKNTGIYSRYPYTQGVGSGSPVFSPWTSCGKFVLNFLGKDPSGGNILLFWVLWTKSHEWEKILWPRSSEVVFAIGGSMSAHCSYKCLCWCFTIYYCPICWDNDLVAANSMFDWIFFYFMRKSSKIWGGSWNNLTICSFWHLIHRILWQS